MIFKGILRDKTSSYHIILASNISYNRIDIYSLSSEDEKITINKASNTLLTSVFIDLKNNKTYAYGDYRLYQQYKNLEQVIKYRMFLSDTILKDAMDVCDEGFVNEYHAKDSISELYRKELNSQLVEVCYVYNDDYCKLTKHNNSNTVGKLADIEYKERTFKQHSVSNTLNKIRSFAEISKMKDLSWLEGKNYVIVDTKEALLEVIQEINQLPKLHIVGFDTETSGLRFNSYAENHPQRDRLVGICIAWKDDHAIYIPVQHTYIQNIDLKYVIKKLKNILETRHLVTHNGAFDYKVMYAYGIKLNICDDTYILERFLSSGDITAKAGLKYLVDQYFKIDQIELSDIFISNSKDNVMAFQDLPYELVRAYAPADADFTRMLCMLLKPRLPVNSYAIYGEEIKCAKNLAWIEYCGCKIDTDVMYKAYNETAQDLRAVESAIYDLVGYKFNVKSVDQLSELLYKKLGCPPIVKMKNNPDRPAVDNKAKSFLSKIPADTVSTRYKSVLSAYEYNGTEKAEVDENGVRRKILVNSYVLNTSKYPVTHLLLKFSDLEKSLSSFYATIERKLKDNSDGMIFSEYKQLRAATGRIISANINFQQIPGDLKHMIIPYSDDYYVVNADFSSVELRIMVSLAQEHGLLEQMFDPENDIHRLVVSSIKNKPAYQINDKERKEGKKYNFGVPYDMGASAFAELLYGYPITQEKIMDAKQAKLDYLNSMPRVRDNFTAFRDYAQVNGYVRTKFGRYLYLPDLVTETDPGNISRGRRRAGNFPIQGLAADIFKIALNRLLDRFRRTNKDVYCPGLIHDEVLLFVNKKHHPYEIIRDIKECMELKVPGFCPLFTGIAIGNSWGETKNGPYELPVKLTEEMMQMAIENRLPVIEGSYRDYVYNEKINYLKNRFRGYLTEMGFNWDNIESNNLNTLMHNMKSMFIGTEIKSMYKVKDDKLSEISKLGYSFAKFIAEETGIDLSHTVENVEEQTTDNTIDIAEYLLEKQIINDIYDIGHEHGDDTDLTEPNDSFVDDREYIKYFNETRNLQDKSIPNSCEISDFMIMGSDIYIDVSNVSKEGVTELVRYLTSIKDECGYFSAKFRFRNDFLDLNIKIANIDRDKIYDIIATYKVNIIEKNVG